MPNHVTTRCTVTGPATDVIRFRERCITAKVDDNGKTYTRLDFEAIIPMPSICHKVEDNGLNADVLALLCRASSSAAIWEGLRRFDHGGHLGPWKGFVAFEKDEIETRLEKAFPNCIAKARVMARCIGETGSQSWYDWSRIHWGTKWNSYSFKPISDEPLEFLFDTAWSFPLPIFEKLAADFPMLRFHCATFDEGWNFACIGYFNPAPGEQPFAECNADDAIYTRVHGHAPERDEEDAA